MIRSVRPSVGWPVALSDGRAVCHHFLKAGKFYFDAPIGELFSLINPLQLQGQESGQRSRQVRDRQRQGQIRDKQGQGQIREWPGQIR